MLPECKHGLPEDWCSQCHPPKYLRLKVGTERFNATVTQQGVTVVEVKQSQGPRALTRSKRVEEPVQAEELLAALRPDFVLRLAQGILDAEDEEERAKRLDIAVQQLSRELSRKRVLEESHRRYVASLRSDD